MIEPTINLLEDATKAVQYPTMLGDLPTKEELTAFHEASANQMPFINQISIIDAMAGLLDAVLPHSFKPLSKEEIAEKYWLAKCSKCYWWGCSRLLNGGGKDYWGEYDDPTCPLCGTSEIDAIDPRKVKFVTIEL